MTDPWESFGFRCEMFVGRGGGERHNNQKTG